MPAPQERRYLDDVPREVQDLIYDGKRIVAIKIVRQDTGAGLREAKEAVDSIVDRLAQIAPEVFAAQKRVGCMNVVLALLTLALTAYPFVRRLFE